MGGDIAEIMSTTGRWSTSARLTRTSWLLSLLAVLDGAGPAPGPEPVLRAVRGQAAAAGRVSTMRHLAANLSPAGRGRTRVRDDPIELTRAEFDEAVPVAARRGLADRAHDGGGMAALSRLAGQLRGRGLPARPAPRPAASTVVGSPPARKAGCRAAAPPEGPPARAGLTGRPDPWHRPRPPLTGRLAADHALTGRPLPGAGWPGFARWRGRQTAPGCAARVGTARSGDTGCAPAPSGPRRCPAASTPDHDGGRPRC